MTKFTNVSHFMGADRTAVKGGALPVVGFILPQLQRERTALHRSAGEHLSR